MESQKKHFVLVHGSCHGGWCWYKLATLLESHGHKVTALDLAGAGINLTHVLDIKSFADYIEPLTSFMRSLDSQEKVILVGHSFNGVAISLAMEAFPGQISVSVFVAAIMPGPDLSIEDIGEIWKFDYKDSQVTFDDGPDKPPTTLLSGPMYMSTLYQNSPPEDLRLGMLLIRPVRVPLPEFMGPMVYTRERYGSVRRAYIGSEQDEAVQRQMVQANPPDEAIFVSGSDHMVMFSKPLELCSYLLTISEKYP